jgi:hypothetical protein
MNKKPKAERREIIVRVPATSAERAAWEKAARHQDRSLAGWLRTTANQVAQGVSR